MKVIDLTNQRTGELCNCVVNHRTYYSYYVEWDDGSVDVWRTIKRKIKFKKDTTEPNGVIYRDDKRWINDGCDARGKEKKPEKRWKEPHSSLAAINVTPRASMLREARKGDDRTAVYLVNSLAAEVLEYAKMERYDLLGLEKTLVELALYPCIYDDKLPLRECAAKLGITRTPYEKTWKPRVEAIRAQWCRPLMDQLGLKMKLLEG